MPTTNRPAASTLIEDGERYSSNRRNPQRRATHSAPAVTVKAYDAVAAISALAPRLSATAEVILLQNGTGKVSSRSLSNWRC
jgi:ketopantoate reductase